MTNLALLTFDKFLDQYIGSQDANNVSKNIARLFKVLTTCHARRRQRQQLLILSDRQLEDIGINRSQALAEAKLGFWH